MFVMVHQGQGLPLGLEAGDDLAAVHARLDDLERDLAADRLAPARPCRRRPCRLRRSAAAACTGRRRSPGLLAGRLVRPGMAVGAALENAGGPVVGLEQALDPPAESLVAAARLVQERQPLGPGGLAQCGGEDRLVTHRTRPPPSAAHEESIAPGGPSPPLYATSKRGRRHQPFIFLRNPARPWRCTATRGRTARHARLLLGAMPRHSAA